MLIELSAGIFGMLFMIGLLVIGDMIYKTYFRRHKESRFANLVDELKKTMSALEIDAFIKADKPIQWQKVYEFALKNKRRNLPAYILVIIITIGTVILVSYSLDSISSSLAIHFLKLAPKMGVVMIGLVFFDLIDKPRIDGSENQMGLYEWLMGIVITYFVIVNAVLFISF